MNNTVECIDDREELVLNMGPHHPATHGVLRFVVHTDGEIMRKAVPAVGYLHRGLEKLAEKQTYPGYMPFTDRINYLEAMFCNQAYAMAVEKLLGTEVPPRAEYLRVIACELNRIANHLVGLGCVIMDLGAFTPFLHNLRERERINDLIEAMCGNRITHNYLRIGGVAHDIDQEWLDQLRAFLDHFDRFLPEFGRLISHNEILIKRMADVAIITGEQAIAYGLVGPNLRASGVDWDLRRDAPYSVYDQLEFDVPVGQGVYGTVGDCYDRYDVRITEMEQSSRILRQCIDKIPEGEIKAKVPKMIKTPVGEVYSCVEGARGELGIYLVSDGTKQPYRLKIRTGSFAGMSIIEAISRGLMIADLVAVIATLDLIAPETDR
jgi:NADH-quinone oxidoreductase subunit D